MRKKYLKDLSIYCKINCILTLTVWFNSEASQSKDLLQNIIIPHITWVTSHFPISQCQVKPHGILWTQGIRYTDLTCSILQLVCQDWGQRWNISIEHVLGVNWYANHRNKLKLICATHCLQVQCVIGYKSNQKVHL